MGIVSRSGVHLVPNTVTCAHQPLLMQKQILPVLVSPVNSITQSAWWSRVLSGMESLVQNSVNHRAGDPEKALILLFMSSGTSIYWAERTFSRCTDGTSVWTCVLQDPRTAAAPLTKSLQTFLGVWRLVQKFVEWTVQQFFSAEYDTTQWQGAML